MTTQQEQRSHDDSGFADLPHQPARPADCRLTPLWRAALVAGAVMMLCGFILAMNLTPNANGYGTHEQLGLPPCSFRWWFGIPCPSCGGTTAFALFVRGRWPAAAEANPAAFGLAALFLVMIPWSLFSAWKGSTWRVSRPDVLLAWILGVFCGVSLLQWAAALAFHLYA